MLITSVVPVFLTEFTGGWRFMRHVLAAWVLRHAQPGFLGCTGDLVGAWPGMGGIA